VESNSGTLFEITQSTTLNKSTAKVAMARHLAIRLYWMWREVRDYEELVEFGSHAGQPGNLDGVC